MGADVDAGSIGVSFKADIAEFVKGVKEVNERLEGFKDGLEALGAFEVFEHLTDSIKECITASSQAEINLRKVQAVVSSQSDVGKFKELAEELSHVTTYSTDASLAAVALLGKFNLTDQQIATMLPKLQDFASFMGTDLSGAAETMGRAVANGSASLRHLGLSFTDAEKKQFDYATESQRVAILQDKLNDKFHGMAEAVAQTGAGAMKQFGNATEELRITLGKLFDSPVASFFGGLTDLVNLATNVLGNMGDTTKTVVEVVLGVGTAFAGMTLAVLTFQKASAFLGGLPTIMSAIASAGTTVAATLMTVVAPLAGIAATGIMIEGMVSRIRAGTLNSNEGAFETIKKDFQQGAADIKGLFAGMFEAPKTEAKSMTEAMQGFDNTLRASKQKLDTMDFSNDLAKIMDKDAFADMGRAMQVDFAQHYNADTGTLLQGDDLERAKFNEGGELADALQGINAELAAQKGAMIGGGMSAADVAATAKDFAAGNLSPGGGIQAADMAMAGLESGAKQLAGRMGATGSAIMNTVNAFAKGDMVGGIVSIGVELISRTKSFQTIIGLVEKLFGEAAQALEPFVNTLVPFVQIFTELAPVLSASMAPLQVFAAIVKQIGEGLKHVVDDIAGIWNGLIDALKSVLGKIPLIGDDLKNWLNNAKIDTSVGTSSTETATKATSAFGDVVKDATKSLSSMNEQTLNVPQGFKVEQTRFEAIQRGLGDPGAVVGAAASQAAAQVSPLVTTPEAIARHALGHALPPAAASTGSTGTVADPVAAAIHIDTVNVQAQDPQDLVKKVQDTASKQAFVQSGSKDNAFTRRMRQYWGG